MCMKDWRRISLRKHQGKTDEKTPRIASSYDVDFLQWIDEARTELMSIDDEENDDVKTETILVSKEIPVTEDWSGNEIRVPKGQGRDQDKGGGSTSTTVTSLVLVTSTTSSRDVKIRQLLIRSCLRLSTLSIFIEGHWLLPFLYFSASNIILRDWCTTYAATSQPSTPSNPRSAVRQNFYRTFSNTVNPVQT